MIGNKEKASWLWLKQINNQCAIVALESLKKTGNEKFREFAEWFINQNKEYDQFKRISLKSINQ